MADRTLKDIRQGEEIFNSVSHGVDRFWQLAVRR